MVSADPMCKRMRTPLALTATATEWRCVKIIEITPNSRRSLMYSVLPKRTLFASGTSRSLFWALGSAPRSSSSRAICSVVSVPLILRQWCSGVKPEDSERKISVHVTPLILVRILPVLLCCKSTHSTTVSLFDMHRMSLHNMDNCTVSSPLQANRPTLLQDSHILNRQYHEIFNPHPFTFQ